MRKVVAAVLCLAIFNSAFAQETGTTGANRQKARGQGAGYSSRDATVLSIMGWGVGIAVAIGAICALIDNEIGGGSNVHFH